MPTYLKPTYNKNEINSLLSNAGFQFTDNCYLTYDGVSGTQSGTLGTTLVSPGLWYVTQPGTMYYVDPAAGPITVIVPNADSSWESKTFSFLKPGQSQNSNSVTLSTAAGQAIGATETSYLLTQPANFVHLLATTYGNLGTLSYRWRRAMYNVSPIGIFTVNPKNGFTTISAGISAAGAKATATEPYIVNINPGIYTETNPIIMPPYVALQGDARDAIIIKPSNPNANMIECNNTNVIKNLTFQSVSGAAAIYIDNVTPHNDDSVIIQDINFIDCKHWIKSVNPANNVIIDSHNLDGKGDCDNALCFIGTSGLSQIIDGIIHNIEYITYSGEVCKNFLLVQGQMVDLTINSLDLEGSHGTIENGVRFYDGCKLYADAASLANCTLGMSGDYLGEAPFIQFTDFSTTSCDKDFDLQHPNMTGFIGGYYNDNHTIVSENFREVRYASESGGGAHFVGDISQKSTQSSPDLNISNVIRRNTSLGIYEGGEIDLYGGLSAQVLSGSGYIKDASTGDLIYEVTWGNTIVEVPSGQNVYITYERGTGIGYQVSIPSYETSIVLGQIISVNGSIDHIVDVPVTMKQQVNGIEAALREGLGPIYHTGSILSVGSDLSLSASQGIYYYGSEIFELSGGSPIQWELYYKLPNNNWTEVDNITSIDTEFYNPSTGGLSAMDTSYYAKHAFYTIGKDNEEDYVFLYAQNQHATLVEVLTASIPTLPSFFSNVFVPLATLITQQGSTDITITDVRPKFGVPSVIAAVGGGGGGVTVHGDLLGLDSDDHEQYLLASGDRAMNGTLNMGNNNIIGVSAVDGVDISSHMTRHLPGGADALTTATPVSINITNQLGIQPSLAKSDHVHAHGNQTNSFLHALATYTTHGFMTSSDYGLTVDINNLIIATSGSWDSTYTTTNENSASWIGGNSSYVTVNTLSGKWDSDYTTTNSNSGRWENVYTQVFNNSASWIGAFTYANTTSATNNNVNTVVQTNSATWSNHPTTTDYVYVYDVNDKTTGATNTWQNLTYSTNVFINGWTHTANTSAFICGKAGLYNISHEGHVYANTNTDFVLEMRALKNFVEIPGSYQFNQMVTTAAVSRTSNSFMVSANLNDNIGFQFSASNTAGSLRAQTPIGGAAHTTDHSTSVRITRIL